MNVHTPEPDADPMLTPSRILALAAGVAFTGFMLFAAHGIAESQSALAPYETKFAAQFPSIGHVDAAAFEAQRSADPSSVAIFDVRTPEEYAVSHLPGAKRADAGMAPAAFLAEAGDVKGKTVAFYCSVGFRSSTLASAVHNALLAAGAKEVVNIRGGIIGWHNQDLPLEANGKPTRFVHPYGPSWAKLLTNPDLARMQPDATP